MKIHEYVWFTLLAILIIVPFFLFDSFVEVLSLHVNNNYLLSSVIYVALLVTSTVIAPLSSPVFLVAGGIFPPIVTAIYNIIGWGLGAIIAFLIARRYRKFILSKFISLNRLEKYENIIPENLEFLSIVLLRIFMPVDFLSYALGLFSHVSFLKYSIATIIGISPFAIIFAYGGNAIVKGEHVSPLVIILFFIVGAYIFKKYKKF